MEIILSNGETKMNRQQIAQIYDSFPESQQDMPREQFIRKTLSALDPNRMVRTVNSMIQKKHWGMRNKRQIDRAMEGGPK